jgi:hypothetical protein
MLNEEPKFRPVIPASKQLQEKMRRLAERPPISFEKALAQTQAAARQWEAIWRKKDFRFPALPDSVKPPSPS